MPLLNGDPVVDIYVSAAGNDNNNGLSTATPKLTIAAAMTLAGLYTVPVNLHLRSGDTFRGAANKLNATIAGMTVDTYGGTAQARVDGGIDIVGNTFTSIGSNRFTTTYKSTSDRSIPTTLSYSGGQRTLKVASQAAVTGPGMWFASSSGTTVTVTVYSTSTPAAQYTSIILDWQTCVRVTAARVTINNIMAINGYVGFHYVGSVDAQGSGQYAFQNSGDGFRFDTGAHGWTSAGDGVHAYDPDGTLIGKVLVPEVVANVAWGWPKRNRLYICATTSLYAILLPVAGAKTM